MKTFLVQSLPLKEVVKDLARNMGTEYTERCDQYFVKIPKRFGQGNIIGIDFDSGMGLIEYDCKFNEDVEIQFIVNKIHPLKFLFCLQGNVVHHFENENEIHNIDEYQNAIVASSSHNGHILRFKKGIAIKMTSLEVNRREFQKKASCELRSLASAAQNLFNDIEAKETFYYEGFYSLQLSEAFEGISQFGHEDFLRKIFLEGKSYLILARQIEQYQDDLKDIPLRSIIRKSELKQIREAAKIIDNKLDSLNSIKDIAMAVGINSNKLQNGFQAIHGMTVNQYIQKRRLKHAKKLIENSDYNMSQITDAIGLNSRSYFSKIFREEFGISPSELRRKNNGRVRNK